MATFRVVTQSVLGREDIEADRWEVHPSGALMFLTKPTEGESRTGLVVIDSGEDVVALFGPGWWIKVIEIDA